MTKQKLKEKKRF